MAFCTSCGQKLHPDARFCTKCGVNVVPGTPPQAAANPSPPVYVGPPKRAGRFAAKVFFLALGLGMALSAAMARAPKGAEIASLISFGAGSAYIAATLRKWQGQPEQIKGAVIAYTVAVLMGIACLGGILGLFADKKLSTSTTPAYAAPAAEVRVNPKEALLRDVKLESKLYKTGFGNILEADFTVTNPTQYSFKDFKIECSQAGPSGTQIDSNTLTIYEIVSANSTKKLKRINMGFINSQAVRSGCRIVDFTVL